MGHYKPLFVWWVVTLFLAAIAGYLGMQDLYTTIYNADITHITSLIAALCLFGNFRIGWLAWKWSRLDVDVPAIKKHMSEWWDASQEFMALGILGTIGGFSYLFYEAFAPLAGASVSDLAAMMPKLLPKIISPMGTIFFCTGAGLASALIIRTQLMLFTSFSGIEDDYYKA